jgi:uncharacterized membrane protein (UPF0127 family)
VAALVLVVACSDPDRVDDPTGALAEALASRTPAAEPFEGYDGTVVTLGGEELRVVVADTPRERSDGLRPHPDPAPYDAMLFLWGDDVNSDFTNSGVTEDLEIAWFDEDGRRVAMATMAACPTGDDCPSYGAGAPYRYAVEAPVGGLPEGDLAGA